MLAHLLFVVLCPQIAVAPNPAEVHQVVHITVAEGAPVPTAVEVVLPDGSRRSADADEHQPGWTFQPTVAGDHKVAMQRDGVRSEVQLLVVPTRRRFVAEPYTCELGRPVRLRVSSLAGTAAIRGVPIQVALPDGSVRPVGVTDEQGMLVFVPSALGEATFALDDDGVRMLAPIRVVPARNRLAYALVCVPLGLVLLWAHLRRWQRQRAAAMAAR